MKGRSLTGARIAADNDWILFGREWYTFEFEGITKNGEDRTLGGMMAKLCF